MKQFFMVWNERSKATSYQHETIDAAKDEARRLAELNSGHTFHVLQSVHTVASVARVELQSFDHFEPLAPAPVTPPSTRPAYDPEVMNRLPQLCDDGTHKPHCMCAVCDMPF